jgi:hypothetical protein
MIGISFERVVRLVAASIVALGLSGCVTTSEVKQDATYRFASDDDFREWLAFYYRNPQPSKLTAGITFMQEHRYLQEFPDVSAVFLSQVFAQNVAALPEWCNGWRSFPKETWNVLLVSLWFTGKPEGQALARENLGRGGPEVQGRLQTSFDKPGEAPSIDLLTAQMHHPRQINLLWAAFSATGDTRYVDRVIDQVHLYGDESDEVGASVGEAAIMSLASNSVQHESVQRICVERNAHDPDPKTRVLLRAMLTAVARVTHGEPPMQPAPEEPAH